MQAPPTRFLERDGSRPGVRTPATPDLSLTPIDTPDSAPPDGHSQARSTSPPLAKLAGAPLAEWLAAFASRPENRTALAHWETIPARPARFADLERPLPEPVALALAAHGIERLYTHQVQAIESLRARRDTVIVTGTASGKSLCYHLPVFETLLEDPEATALYLFPTKALAQDQLQGLSRLTGSHPELLRSVVAGVYDGDTQASTRRKLRDDANVILSNPDMLHQGILPSHARWGRFFRNLRYVVVDEMHAYRGIFGSHVANVFRRLERVVAHVGGEFRYVLCSATIRNPGELAGSLVGRDVHVVDDDGAPRGEKHFVFWNPPYADDTKVERRSSNGDGCTLFSGLVAAGAQALAFTKSRVAAELVYRYARERMEHLEPKLADRIKPYRGGYLPEERRAIERALFSGETRGVVSTNALELGVDIGGLDAVVMIGAPPTLASAWQQAGRAGRKGEPALAVLVAYNDTVDQYLMRHPDYFFGRSPEAAVIDPHNPYILAQQLACAAYELPLAPGDARAFGPQTPAILQALEDAGETRTIDDRSYWAKTEFPAAKVSLRTISDDTYTIMDVKRGNAVMGNVDAISAMELVYPEAIYLHEGETCFVRELDLVQKVAYVEPREVDYYTQPVLDTNIRVRHELERRDWRGESVRFGEVTYSWQTVAMKKIRFHSIDAIGYHPLDLPRLSLETTGFWFAPGEESWRAVARQGLNPIEGLSGVRNLFLTLLSMLSMCDPSDLGGMIDSSNLGRPGLFVFDRYPGGLGFSEQGYSRLEELAHAALEHVPGLPVRNWLPLVRGPAAPAPGAAAGPRPRARARNPGQARGARVAGSLARMNDRAVHGDRVASAEPGSRAAMLVLSGIVVFSVALRLYRLDEPFGGFHCVNDVFYTLLARGYLHLPFFAPFVNTLDPYNPPLFATLVRESFARFGESEAAGRIVSALACTGCVVYAYRLSRLLHGVRAGLVSALLLSVTPAFFIIGRNVQVDTLMLFFVLAFLHTHVVATRARSMPLAAVSGALLGLGLLSKLPAGLAVVPAAVFTMLSPERRRSLVRGAVTLAVACLVAASWYGIQVVRRRGGYIADQAHIFNTINPPTTLFFWKDLFWTELVWGLGPPLFVLAIAGLVPLVRRPAAESALVLAGLGVYAGFYAFFHFHTYYLLPFMAFAVLGAAHLLVRVFPNRVPLATATGAVFLASLGFTFLLMGGHKYGHTEYRDIQEWFDGLGNKTTLYVHPDIRNELESLLEYYGGTTVFATLTDEVLRDPPPGSAALTYVPATLPPHAEEHGIHVLMRRAVRPVAFGFAWIQEPANYHKFAVGPIHAVFVGAPYFGLVTREEPTGFVLIDLDRAARREPAPASRRSLDSNREPASGMR